jgi:hypothetical protein
MERTYTLRSKNRRIDGTTVKITGACLAEIKCKADRILRKCPEVETMEAVRKGVPA